MHIEVRVIYEWEKRSSFCSSIITLSDLAYLTSVINLASISMWLSDLMTVNVGLTQ